MHMTARIFQHAYLPLHLHRENLPLHLHRENLWDYKWSRDPTHVFVVKFGGIMDPAILLAIQRDLVRGLALGSRGIIHISFPRINQHIWSQSICFDASRRQKHDSVLIIPPALFLWELHSKHFFRKNICFKLSWPLDFHGVLTVGAN